MKRLLYIGGIGMFVISILGACSLFGGGKEETLNGVMLVGEQQVLKAIEDKHKQEIKLVKSYTVKQSESEGK